MNNSKPGRKFSGNRKKSPYKGKDKSEKDNARQERKNEYYGKSKRLSSERNFDKPKEGYIKDNSEKPRGSYFKKDTSEKSFDKPRRSFTKDSSEKPRRNFNNDSHSGEHDKFKKRFTSDKEDRKKSYPEKNFNRSSKSFSKNQGEKSFDKPKRNSDGYREDKDTSIKHKRSFSKNDSGKSIDKDGKSFSRGYEKKYKDKRFYKKDFSKKKDEKPTFAEQGLIRLNKYIANAGICSRREADDLIRSGCVNVNGKVISELGFKVREGDVVNYSGTHIKTEKPVYLLLNKPKDYITTAADDRGRRTVMELITGACKERIYPVGRLDRNTTGLLLFTNDGEVTKKLTHPKHNVQKLYHVELDKNLKQTDLLKIRDGIELEDGPIKPDEVSYAGETKREVGIQIHSGANRVVRRIFESLEYEVIKLDRVMFAGLTKKNLPKGRWRFLTETEISFLKMV